MKFVTNIILQGLLVYLTTYLLPGASVDNLLDAIVVALVLAVANTFIKPILTILTLPITIITLGLFLLVINGIIILIVDAVLSGFHVQGLLTAIIFSIVLSIFNYLFLNYSK